MSLSRWRRGGWLCISAPNCSCNWEPDASLPWGRQPSGRCPPCPHPCPASSTCPAHPRGLGVPGAAACRSCPSNTCWKERAAPLLSAHPGPRSGGHLTLTGPRPCHEASSGSVSALYCRWENNQKAGGVLPESAWPQPALTCTWAHVTAPLFPPPHSPASSHFHTHCVCLHAHSTQKPHTPMHTCTFSHTHTCSHIHTLTWTSHMHVHTHAHSHIPTHTLTFTHMLPTGSMTPVFYSTHCGVTVTLEHWWLCSGGGISQF